MAGLVCLLLGVTAASAEERAELVGDEPREEVTTSATIAATSVPTTTYRVDSQGTAVLRVDEGGDLDRYVFRSGSPIRVPLQSSPYVDAVGDPGPTAADGTPAPGNPLSGTFGRLTLRVFDVDDDYSGTQVKPEVDVVSFNGVELPRALTGANDQWSINTFEVPMDALVLPTEADPLGSNTVEVAVDTLNTTDTWAVEVDFVELRPVVDALPLAVAHGLGEGAGAMDEMVNWFSSGVSGLTADDVMSLTHEAIGSTAENAEQIATEIDQLRADTGAAQVNVLAHSKGGLDTRRAVFEQPGSVRSLVMLGTPNGGSEIAQDFCDSARKDGLLNWFGRNLNANATDCRGDDPTDPLSFLEDATFQTTQVYVRNIFNRIVRDRNDVDYFNLSGQQSVALLAGWESGEDDGVVSVESTRWKAFDAEVDPGVHDYWPEAFEEHHFELTGRTFAPFKNPAGPSESWPVAACRMYGPRTNAPCETNRAAASGTLQATATTDPVRTEFTGARVVTAAADASVDVVLPLEGGTSRVVVLGQRADTRGLQLAGVDMEPSAALGYPAAAATVDGLDEAVLSVPAGPDPMDLLVLVAVDSSRSVAVSIEPLAVAGQPTTVVAHVTEPDADDALEVDLGGAPIAMTQVAPGRWEAQVNAPSAPHTPVVVTTGGARPRTGSGLLSTTDGRAELAGTFGEAVRRDAAGHITELTLAPNVTTAEAGTWRVTLSLRSDDGRRVDDATGAATLPAGGGPVPVALDGASLAEAGIDGPWQVVDVLLTDAADDSFVDLEPTLGTTAAYRVADLAGERVQIGTVFTDRLVDGDGDGDADALKVDGIVDVRTSGTYAINARLVSLDGEPLGEFATFSSLPAGTSPFTLGFSGGAIGRSGIDGPYRVVDLSVYAVADQNDAFDFRIEAHRTQPYVSWQFDGGRVTIEDVLVALQAMEDEGLVPQGIARSLAVKLHGAVDARDRGQPGTACNKLEAFSSELEAQAGKHVPVATADELSALSIRATRPLCG